MNISKTVLRSGESQRQHLFVALLFISLSLPGKIFGQQTSFENNSNSSLNVNFSVAPFTPYFIDNKGQFDQYVADNSKNGFISPSYGSQMGNAIVLFNGNSIQFVENIIKNNDKGEKEKDLKEDREFLTWRQTMSFVDGNPNSTFEVEEAQQQYFTYPDKKIKNGTITANAWGKLICKNIYAGIDVEFSYKKEGGIKYSFIVHPGADPSLIKMKWSGVDNLVIDANGNLQMNSQNGVMTDKAPTSFYLNDETSFVSSNFKVNDKTVSFSLGNYDHTKTLVIDPWVFSPALTGNNRAYDIQHDPTGNIYFYGGSNPYQLKKFTSAGAPLWTYNTAATGYYGDFVIDGAGNAFCVYGPWGDQCVKITSAGAMVWSVSQNNSREIYRVYPNPVNVGQLTIMGMGMPSGLCPMVLNIDMTTGAYSVPSYHPTNTAGETRGMAVDVNGDAYGLVFSTASANAPNNLLWKVNSANTTITSVQDGYLLWESQASNTDSWYSGYNGVAVGCFVYTYDGITIKKWDKITLGLLASAVVPGGIGYVTAGVCIDLCGNVYVGGPNSIREYDGNLGFLTSVATTGQVYDVNLGNVPGEILGCGNGFFGSYSFPICTSSAISVTATPATCSGCNGTATVTMNPSGAYTYSWSPSGGTGSTATGLCAGTYTVTATLGCFTYTASIVVPNSGGGLTTASTQTNLLCNGVCTGSAITTITGGTGPFTFVWSPLATNSTVGNVNTGTNLCAGTYTVTSTDANGCTGSNTITITQPPALATTFSQVNPLCNGGTGTASVVASGGTGSYTYAWSPSGGTGATSSAITAGNYTCTITDANGCTLIHAFVIVAPSAVTAISSSVPATCGNSNGSASVAPSGGTSPYTYLWSSGGSAATESGLVAGSYTCTITDANGCSTTSIVVVSNSSAPTATITASTNILCFGGNNGSATVLATGGTSPYLYSWSPSGGTLATASSLIAGIYVVTVTDASGCIATATVTLTEPPLLTATATSTNILCNGQNTGTATIAAISGTGPYTYAWSPSGGTGTVATGLIAGSYTCTVTDANGCITTASTTITQPLALTTVFTQVDVLCNGGNNGSATVSPSGGTGIYTYAWTPSGGANATASSLIAGTYTCTITDANGCSITQPFTIVEPIALVLTLSETDANCAQANGTASSVATGGTGAYSYLWMPGNIVTQNLTNIVSGTYTCTVTDANSCSVTSTIVVNNISGVLASVSSFTNIACLGGSTGSINVTQVGGTGPYTYNWLPNISVSSSANGIPAGTYQITVTDATGCTSTVTITLTQPPLLTITATATPTAVCNGAPVNLNSNPAGGTPALNVVWTPGNLVGNSQNIIPTSTTTYTATVIDANGCSTNDSTTVMVNPVPVAALVGNLLSGCAPVCVNFSDLSTVANPGLITSWSWDFGDNSALSNSQNPTHCYNSAGIYTVVLTVVTVDGCTSTLTMPNYINVFVNPVAAFSVNPQPATMMNPLISFTDSSTNASSWNWSFGDILNSTSTLQNPTFSYVDPTCYAVVLSVSTIHGCIDTATDVVCIGPETSLYIPNAFTPNGDGMNDVFNVLGMGLDPNHFEMWIFDRWGNLIFYTEDLNKGWDGKVQGASEICQIDTYVWKIKAKDVNDDSHNLIGRVSLIK